MNKGLMLAAFAVLLVGFAFADVQGASVEDGATGKYQTPSAGDYTTEGGNVTEINVSANVSTEKWAGFYGNVSGNILLKQGDIGSAVYVWSWTPTSGGEVCAAKSSTFSWTAAAFTAVTKAIIDGVWSFPTGDTDSATSTSDIVDNAAAYNIAGKTSTTVGFTDDQSWQTFALNDTVGVNEAGLAFCVNMSTTGSKAVAVGIGDYQLVVPTDMAFGQYEQYYFFVELN